MLQAHVLSHEVPELSQLILFAHWIEGEAHSLEILISFQCFENAAQLGARNVVPAQINFFETRRLLGEDSC